MASLDLMPMLPSFFRRRAYVPSPEEAREIERKKSKEEFDRLIASLRPRPRTWRNRRRDRREALANDAAKREWIDEQKRLIAETKQRSGNPHPCWNDDARARDRRRMRAAVEELSAAFEAKKSQWMAAHQRSGSEEARRRSTAAKVHPLVPTDAPEVDGTARRPCSPGEERPEHDDAKIERVAPVNGPRSDAEFRKSAVEQNPWGGGGRRRSAEYYAMRREVLRRCRAALDEECEGAEPESACATRKKEDGIRSFCSRLRAAAAATRSTYLVDRR
ncbi:hypothetical protein D1007_17774 [Hordeum vulgare]|uniref:Uncharacterized protein n=1 Tax=Hordeum vulgare subsp. vulgare TaxID=112509 RepID=A0A8I6Y7X3_HORVV|nr:hypothetical protein D1007_17774 [Hordeum vulgare]KAI4994017.1 hypothetical protein ZWY2020_008330 [Hordeum vulgare]